MDTPDPDRDFWITTGLLGGFAGLSRLMTYWDHAFIWQRIVGKVMTSMLVAGMSRLMFWESLQEHPTILLALTAAGGWLGADIINLMVDWAFGLAGKRNG